MSADYNPLDTSQRNKVLQIIQQLADAGLSDSDIMNYFNQSQSLGKQSLTDYLSTAGTAISRQFQPQIDQTRDLLGANPLLADSGYSNRLNRQVLTDLAARTSEDYNRFAGGLSQQNLGFYRDLVGQRAGLRSDLARGGYQTMTALPKKPTIGQQIGQGLTSLAGSAIGAYAPGLGGGGGGGYSGASQLNTQPWSPQDALQQPSYGGPRRARYPWGDR